MKNLILEESGDIFNANFYLTSNTFVFYKKIESNP